MRGVENTGYTGEFDDWPNQYEDFRLAQAKFYQNTGRPDEAFAVYNEAIYEASSDVRLQARLLYERAKLFIESQAYRQAIEDLNASWQRLDKSDPEETEAMAGLFQSQYSRAAHGLARHLASQLKMPGDQKLSA
ncbi:MAG TPA: hypothetical protein VFP35_04305 [Candidatus Saccharimonadales bacterium]|nr:hypothetical protein [Candidatus Saccharimonadales bacterium]